VNDPNSQYLAELDRNGTVLISTSRDIVGRNVFSEYVYNTHVDKSAYDHYRRVMDGSPSISTFSFRTGDRINIGEPIILDGKPAYFLLVVTPAASIYADMDRVLATHRTENLLLLGGLSAAVSLSVFFLIRWNNTLSKAVQVRTRQLEDANKALQVNEKLQKEFVNVAAHELRTPIQPILGTAELM
jgi:signal transduction histidine kinase